MSAIVDFPVKPEVAPYLDAFALLAQGRRAAEPEWLAQIRRAGLQRFAEAGFPSRRSEAWRYLDLSPLQRRPMLPVVTGPLGMSEARARMAGREFAGAGSRLVLVDGEFAPELSSIDVVQGVWLGSMAVAIAERREFVAAVLDAAPVAAGEPFAALNAALFADGFVLHVAPGVAIDRPIEILHLVHAGAAGSIHTRNLVALGAHSRATIFETYADLHDGEGRYWRNDVLQIRLDEGATLDRVVLVEEAAEAVHLGEATATLAAGASLHSFALLLGGGTVRQEISVAVAGKGASCRLDGAFAIGGREEANIVATVDHRATHGETRELVKGVAAGQAHGAFQGRIIVREGAQKVDAHQTSRNLLIGSRASIDTKPELEIYADDVKCSHGATVGDLDEAALFYMQARGIPPGEARRLLIEAFLREAVEHVEDAAVRDHLLQRLAGRLSTLEASK